MKRVGLGLLVAMAVTVALPAAAAVGWRTAEFSVRRPRKLVLLPPSASIVRGRVTDAVPMVKETVAFEPALAARAAAVLRAKGYEVDDTSLAPEALATDDALRDEVQRVKDRLGDIMPALSQRPRAVRQGRYTIGEAAIPLGVATGAEGLLILDSQTIIPSKGQRTLVGVLSVLGGGFALPTTQTQLMGLLVDARTGRVEAIEIGATGGAVLKEPEDVAARVVADTFQAFPRADEVVRSKRKQRRAEEAIAAAESRPDAQALDESDVLAEYERVAAGMPEEAPDDDEPEDVGPASGWSPPEAPITMADAVDAGAPPRPVAAPMAAADEAAAVRALLDAPSAGRPAATHRVVLQRLADAEAGAGLLLRNMSPQAMRVTVGGSAWLALDRGGEAAVAVAPGSHVVLASADGATEAVRASVIVPASGTMLVELWPR